MSHFAKSLILGLSASVLVLGTSVASDKAKEKQAMPTPDAMLAKLDKDKDGKLSLEEFIANAKTDTAKEAQTAKFKTADADADGALTLDEYKTTIKSAAKAKKPAAHKEE